MQSLILFAVLWTCGLCFTCLNNNNIFVDWYTVYKIPKIIGSDDPLIRNGWAQFYLDVNSTNWTRSPRRIDQPEHAVYHTLDALYSNNNPDTMMYMMYSDTPPKQRSISTRGHTKGVVAFDKTKNAGFWLIHSVPHFPPNKSLGYSFLDASPNNGQSFLCISFKYQELKNIATQLLYNEITLYDFNVSQPILRDFPVLGAIIRKQNPPGSFSIINMTSSSGQKFTSFAKSGQFGADLYDSLVAPYLQQDLQVQTWPRGRGGRLRSNCTAEFNVYNVQNITLPGNVRFGSTVDHSKWAVSSPTPQGKQPKRPKLDAMNKWTCIGDINRFSSQFTRGGGVMCLDNYNVWMAYSNSVEVYEHC